MYDLRAITGHGALIKNLTRSVAERRIHHAYIFEGAPGAGKMSVAQAFAKAAQCETPTADGFCCGRCASCVVFDSGNHPDLFYVTPSKTKALGVDDIRDQIHKEAAIKPYRYKHKIFIIPHAETMTPSAQNALLKTLESPPGYAVFLLTAVAAQLLLPTVLSRCFTLKLHPLPFDTVLGYLTEQAGLPEETARFFAVYAGGSIGRASAAAADETFTALRAKMIAILDGIREKDLADVFALAKELDTVKNNIGDALDVALLWYRDLAALKELGDAAFLYQRDITNRLKNNVQIAPEALYASIDAVWDAKTHLRANANFQLTAEVLLMKLNEPLKTAH